MWKKTHERFIDGRGTGYAYGLRQYGVRRRLSRHRTGLRPLLLQESVSRLFLGDRQYQARSRNDCQSRKCDDL